MRDVVITHAVRTPIGRIGGSLRNIPGKERGRLRVIHIFFKEVP
jgi:acetyl-CoA acetyltransferase